MSKINYNIRIANKHLQALDEYKARTGIARTDIIRQALQEFIEKHDLEG